MYDFKVNGWSLYPTMVFVKLINNFLFPCQPTHLSNGSSLGYVVPTCVLYNYRTLAFSSWKIYKLWTIEG